MFDTRKNYLENLRKYSFIHLGSLLKAYFFDSVSPELLLRSQILVDANQKIVLMWVPKSGSTFGVNWFFAQRGLLFEAQKHYKFIHRYRDEVYRFSTEHRKSLGGYLKKPHDYSVIKIVRHPLKRAVSSYIHAVKYKFAYKEISHFLGRNVNQERGFSFREFVGYLESININTCNIHFRSQVHPLEKSGKITIDYLIDLEDSVEKLGELERKLGLHQTDLTLFMESKHHTIRTEVEGFYGDRIDYYGRKKKRGRKIVTPPAANFYDENLLEKVGKIYAEDFERYGYLPLIAQIQTHSIKL